MGNERHPKEGGMKRDQMNWSQQNPVKVVAEVAVVRGIGPVNRMEIQSIRYDIERKGHGFGCYSLVLRLPLRKASEVL